MTMATVPHTASTLPTRRAELARYAAAIARHAGRTRPWRPRDTEAARAIARACWRFERLSRANTYGAPSWVWPLVGPTEGRTRHMGAWAGPLGAIWAAHASGQVGVLITAEEGAAIWGCCPRTWRRWVARWEHEGLVRVTATYRGLPGELGRARGPSIYAPGPELLRASRGAAVEGIAPRVAARRARAARRAAHVHRAGRRRALVRARDAAPSREHRSVADIVRAGRAPRPSAMGGVTRRPTSPPSSGGVPAPPAPPSGVGESLARESAPKEPAPPGAPPPGPVPEATGAPWRPPAAWVPPWGGSEHVDPGTGPGVVGAGGSGAPGQDAGAAWRGVGGTWDPGGWLARWREAHGDQEPGDNSSRGGISTR